MLADEPLSAIAKTDAAGREGGDLHAAWSGLVAALEPMSGQPAVPETMFPRLASLPFTASEAIAQMAMTRVVNERILSGFYRDNLAVLATMEKSASTMHEVSINRMLQLTAGRTVMVPTPRQNLAGPVHLGGGASISTGMLQFFPNGGTLRGAFEPSRQNMLLLGEFGSRAVILMRHPADRIVAQYCMRASEFDRPTPFRDVFLDDDLPFSVDPLLHALRWIAGWKGRSLRSDRILVARYEDMLHDHHAHFDRIHRFLFDCAPSGALMAELSGLHASVVKSQGAALQSGDASTRSYKKGWTGRAGVWRDYLDEADIAAYNATTRQFISSDPAGKLALEVYPDLLLD